MTCKICDLIELMIIDNPDIEKRAEAIRHLIRLHSPYQMIRIDDEWVPLKYKFSAQ